MFKFIGNKCKDESREEDSLLDSRGNSFSRDSEQYLISFNELSDDKM